MWQKKKINQIRLCRHTAITSPYFTSGSNMGGCIPSTKAPTFAASPQVAHMQAQQTNTELERSIKHQPK